MVSSESGWCRYVLSENTRIQAQESLLSTHDE